MVATLKIIIKMKKINKIYNTNYHELTTNFH